MCQLMGMQVSTDSSSPKHDQRLRLVVTAAICRSALLHIQKKRFLRQVATAPITESRTAIQPS